MTGLAREALEECVMLDRITTPDGYGSFYSQWIDGAHFQAAFTVDNSVQARVAAVQGVTALYTITTGRNVNLRFHDVLRRVSDGMVFRVTSNGTDKQTPKSAGLDMRQVTAEEWRLADG